MAGSGRNADMQRIYLPARMIDLERLRDGAAVSLPAVLPASDDELDEFTALAAAAKQADVVIAADVDDVDAGGTSLRGTVTAEQVASFHLDADGSGDLAWYAPQELDDVIALLRG